MARGGLLIVYWMLYVYSSATYTILERLSLRYRRGMDMHKFG